LPSTLDQTIDQVRDCRPVTRRQLWYWVHRFTGIKIPYRSICPGHAAPFDLFARQVLERPSLALWRGPRGSGKSFLSAIDTHVTSRFNPRYGTRILGGSLAQSEQIYEALRDVVLNGRGSLGGDRESLLKLGKRSGTYRNGSVVSILAASETSVRGSHTPSLKLDEVDEIEPDIIDSAMGIAMNIRGTSSSVLMTSTMHRVAGPMAALMERGLSGDHPFPVDTYCVFEVLERCPDERSGPALENCPQCPIFQWCHADRDRAPGRIPKAKRSNGHYSIDSFIQKTAAVSARVLESDYLCWTPRAAGVWFTTFDPSPAVHVRLTAEYDRRWPIFLAVDPGVETGAVWFQLRPNQRGSVDVNVFGDYYAYDAGAGGNAKAILAKNETLCGVGIRHLKVTVDPAIGNKTSSGPIVRAEYEREGLRGYNGLESWSVAHKQQGLQLVEALLKSADGYVSLTIHPRCKHLITAFLNYVRDRVRNQWLDRPKDPQHPHEETIDSLCGGLKLELPEGRTPPSNLRTVSARGL
jgi:hypothetical protein